MGKSPAYYSQFDGKLYTSAVRSRKKSVADKHAVSYRKKGWLARVMPHTIRDGGITWYMVYVRRM